MGDVVKLRAFRKRAARAAREAEAEANRLRFGRPKALRDASRRETERARQHLEGHLLDRNRPDGEAS